MDLKDFRELEKKLLVQGFRIEKKKKGWMVLPPAPDQPGVTIHKTEGKSADRQTLRRLKQVGFIDR